MALQCLTRQTLCVLRGQALDILIAVVDQAGEPVDVELATVVFGIGLAADQPYLHELPVEVSGDVISASLSSTLAAQLTAKQYYFSCWVTISSESTPVVRGTLTVQNDSRSVT